MNGEKETTLTYTVKIRTYGKPKELEPQIGRALARECALQFGKNTTVAGKKTYKWDPTAPAGGRASDCVDNENAAR